MRPFERQKQDIPAPSVRARLRGRSGHAIASLLLIASSLLITSTVRAADTTRCIDSTGIVGARWHACVDYDAASGRVTTIHGVDCNGIAWSQHYIPSYAPEALETFDQYEICGRNWWIRLRFSPFGRVLALWGVNNIGLFWRSKIN
jgi:hypothetical protein